MSSSSITNTTQEELDLLGADDLIIHIEGPAAKQGKISTEHASTLIRQLRSTSRTISIGCSLVVVLSIACVIILAVVIAFSSSLAKERKILLSTIMGVILLGIQMVLCVSRKDPNTLIIFSIISAFISGLCLGLSIWYI